jgi:hypothetical protein
MEKFLIFIKHNFKIGWRLIEWLNAKLFSILYYGRLTRTLPSVFRDYTLPPFSCRELSLSDADSVRNLIESQESRDLEYFKPHGFDLVSIRKQLKNRSFLAMGVFSDDKLIGYFFLRFFSNRKCFVGRLIDYGYRGKGIGELMNNIMYSTAWRMKFRCLSTISRKNIAVMKAHSKNQRMVVLKVLQNDFILVEFLEGNPL